MRVGIWLGLLMVLYAAAKVATALPGRVPMAAIVASNVLLPLAFALIHGAAVYRVRGILVFTALCLVVGNLLENLSVLTGFPFGRYHFTDVMGPKLFYVPIMLGLAYVGMGYLSWILGGLILGGFRVWTLPLVAAFIMVAWDLSTEPIWANLARSWVWHDGGPYFGVPVSNFFGWYLTVYLIYLFFALYLRRQPASARKLPSAFWGLAVAMYGISAAGNLFVAAPAGLSVVTDATGAPWRVGDILGVSRLVSIFVMGAFALVAWVRAPDNRRKT